MSIAYRDPEEPARIRLDALICERAREDAGVDEAAAVYARRAARAAAGAALALGGLILGGSVLGDLLAGAPMFGGAPALPGDLPGAALAARAIGAVWATAAAAYVAARLGAAPWLRARVTPVSRSGDVHEDLARLEAAEPEADARARAGALERASVALPLAGLALLAPLSIHLVVLVLAAGADSDFAGWTRPSVVLVGHAHLALAICGVKFARKLGRLRTSEILRDPGRDGWRALLITMIVAAVPGALLYLIPPLLVGATGLLFVPASFALLRAQVIRERRALDIEIPPAAAPLNASA